MNVGSLFSGIGGMDLGLHRAGLRHAFFCEQDAFRRRVLERHWPGVPVYEDVAIMGRAEPRGRPRGADDGREHGPVHGQGCVDLLAGGFPCQDLSVAGRRRGLAGERSGLFFEFARVADAVLPAGGWLLIENVPGLLSSHGGRDFAVLLASLAELGFHDLAWRVLDSRHFGVPQRRRRVFILARRASGRSACEVLLEPESGGGDFEAGRAKGEGTSNGAKGGVAKPLGAKVGFRQDLDHDTYISTSADPDRSRAPTEPAGRVDGEQWAAPLTTSYGRQPDSSDRAAGPPNLVSGAGRSGVTTPIDPKPDGPRYAACGDAVTSNVAEWIGRRLREAA